ncbi:ROK family protein [Clostridiaceae bacterium M8S5]|nr:ROK family protein [Clostridiaceae bacterium M8S5]
MFIGVDLGGTNIAVGIVDSKHNILNKVSVKTLATRSSDEIIDDIKNTILKVIEMSNLKLSDIEGVGIGVPGLVDDVGNVISCVNLNWYGVKVTEKLKMALGKDIYIDNDATVAAIAEKYIGAMKEAESGVFITLGTGIGSGIIIDNKVYRGHHRIGAELGHMIIGENFYDCNCGKNGCFETFASSTAIIKYTEKLLKETDEESMLRGNTIDAKAVFDCAKKGDKLAQKSVNRLVKYLAMGIQNIICILDPQVIAIGGGISGAGDYLLDMVKKEIGKDKNYSDMPIAEIKLSQSGNQAGIIGAAMLCKCES